MGLAVCNSKFLFTTALLWCLLYGRGALGMKLCFAGDLLRTEMLRPEERANRREKLYLEENVG